MKILSVKELKEIKARCEAATEGPWEFFSFKAQPHPYWGGIEPLYSNGNNHNPFWLNKCDGKFIAHARKDLPDCLDEIERLRGLVQQAYYEGGNDAHAHMVWNNSNAREALGKI